MKFLKAVRRVGGKATDIEIPYSGNEGGDSQTIAEILSVSNDADQNTLNNLDWVGANAIFTDTIDIQNSDHIEINPPVTLNGDLNANGKKITGLPEPVADSEAATKIYVDLASTPPSLEAVLSIGRDTGGAEIVGMPDPTQSDSAASKNYVDTAHVAAHVADGSTVDQLRDALIVAGLMAPS
jgi:hypothetical protein